MEFPSLPAFLPRIAGRLPHLPFSAAMAAGLNLAAWPALRELDWQDLRGRRFCIHIRDLGLRAYLAVGPEGFAAQVNAQADVTFTASAEDYARLALRLEDPDTLFFNRRLTIEGNTDLGLRVKNMLDALELEQVAAAMPLGMGRWLLAARRQLLNGV
jgi:predicted lipid carrier protein YhbT